MCGACLNSERRCVLSNLNLTIRCSQHRHWGFPEALNTRFEDLTWNGLGVRCDLIDLSFGILCNNWWEYRRSKKDHKEREDLHTCLLGENSIFGRHFSGAQ